MLGPLGHGHVELLAELAHLAADGDLELVVLGIRRQLIGQRAKRLVVRCLARRHAPPSPTAPHPLAALSLFLTMQENFMTDNFATALARTGGASVRNSTVTIPGTPAFQGITAALRPTADLGAGLSAQALLTHLGHLGVRSTNQLEPKIRDLRTPWQGAARAARHRARPR